MNIKTTFMYSAEFYWQAIDIDSYDVCEDPDCSCRAQHPIGRGETEIAAVRDLLNQVEEERLCRATPILEALSKSGRTPS